MDAAALALALGLDIFEAAVDDRVERIELAFDVALGTAAVAPARSAAPAAPVASVIAAVAPLAPGTVAQSPVSAVALAAATLS